MWLGVYLVVLLVAAVVSSVVGVLRGYSAVYGAMLALLAFAMTAIVGGWGAMVAPILVERWTREPPQEGRDDHPVRWPYERDLTSSPA